MKIPFIYLFIILALTYLPVKAEVIDIKNLNYEDEDYNLLYESTIASKNRIIRGVRKERYDSPSIFRYLLKAREDIWTIIAKTSLNIDTIATLNRIDFIGMIKEEIAIYLPDTLGIFIEFTEDGKKEIVQRFKIEEDDILTIKDPIKEEASLYFLPEVELTFLERIYLTGVVFHAPLMGIETSKFGMRQDPFINEMAFHGGVDIAAKEGKIVRASRWGKVFYRGEADGYGNVIILKHELGYYTLYGHLKEILIEEEENVDTGQSIGTVGITGRTTGPHLHFEIRRYSEKLSPDNIPFFLDHR